MTSSINFEILANQKKERQEKIPLSNVFRVQEGGFGARLKTYFASVAVQDLEDIRVFDEIVELNIGNDKWPVSKIIQREVDEKRVQEIKKYIKDGSRTKYFPPITVVILPFVPNTQLIAEQFEACAEISAEIRKQIWQKVEGEWSSADADKSGIRKAIESSILSVDSNIAIDGIYLLPAMEAFDFQYLAWDKSKQVAIAIDGQHRLSALRSAAKDLDGHKIAGYRQDIVFIDIASELEAKPNSTAIDVVRNIFIDVNSRAETVSNVLKYIMDDNTLSSRLLQIIVDDSNQENLDAGVAMYPQQLDWFSLDLKTKAPFVTSILVLYQLMDDIVMDRKDLKSFDDYTNPGKIDAWITHLRNTFAIDSLVKTYNQTNHDPIHWPPTHKVSTKSGEEEDESEDTVFTYDDRIIDLICDKFATDYAPKVVSFFRELYPYKLNLDFAKAHGAFESGIVKKALLLSEKKRELPANKVYKSEFAKYLEEFTQYIRKNRRFSGIDLLQTVVFQKAAFAKYLSASEGGESAGANWLAMANNFLESVCIEGRTAKYFFDTDYLIDEDICKEYALESNHYKQFWEGIALEDTKIRYQKRGQNALGYVFDLAIRRYAGFEIEFDSGKGHINGTIARQVATRKVEDKNSSIVDQITKQVIDAKRKQLYSFIDDLRQKHKT